MNEFEEELEPNINQKMCKRRKNALHNYEMNERIGVIPRITKLIL